MPISLKRVDFIHRVKFEPQGMVQGLVATGDVKLTFDAGLVRCESPVNTVIVPAANVSAMVEQKTETKK